MSENNVVQLGAPAAPPSQVEPKLLGAVLDLADPANLFESCALDAGDFTDRRVSTAWAVARKIAEKRRPLSALTLFSAMKAARLADDSLFDWLQELQATNSLNTEGFLNIAEDLRRGVRGRRVAGKLEELARQLRHGRYNAAAVGADLEAVQFDISGSDLRDETADSDLHELLDRWDERERTGKKGLVPTGIKALDDVIGGWDFRLNVVVGQPGVGKNALIGATIISQLENDPNIHIGLFGLEDGSAWLTKRWVARQSGLSVREVGTKMRTQTERDALENEIIPGLHPMLKRLHIYTRDEIKLDDWRHQAMHWVRNRGVSIIYLDNMGQLDHSNPFANFRGPPDNRMSVAKAAKSFAWFAAKQQVPVVVLCHSTRAADDGERPPKLSEIAESAFIERRARKAVGVWIKNRQLRATILKDQEGPGAGTTLELGRFESAALVDPDAAKEINTKQEEREERAQKEADKEARSVESTLRRRKMLEKLKANNLAKAEEAKAAEPTPQISLLDVPASKPPERTEAPEDPRDV